MSARSVTLGAFAFLVSVAPAVSAGAFDAKQITLKVGYGAGGTYDLSSRLVARHLGEFLPGKPEIVVQNVPGGGSLKLTKLMLGSEPADGSVIASVSPAMAVAPRARSRKRRFRCIVDPVARLAVGGAGLLRTSKASGIDTMDKFLRATSTSGHRARTA